MFFLDRTESKRNFAFMSHTSNDNFDTISEETVKVQNKLAESQAELKTTKANLAESEANLAKSEAKWAAAVAERRRIADFDENKEATGAQLTLQIKELENASLKAEIVTPKATIGKHEAAIVALKADMKSIKADIVALKADIVALKATIGKHEAMIGKHEADIVALKADMKSIKADSVALKATIGTMFDAFVRRVVAHNVADFALYSLRSSKFRSLGDLVAAFNEPNFRFHADARASVQTAAKQHAWAEDIVLIHWALKSVRGAGDEVAHSGGRALDSRSFESVLKSVITHVHRSLIADGIDAAHADAFQAFVLANVPQIERATKLENQFLKGVWE
jgi:septal ring factor EnvC (AmiA/AmiB activator)